MLKTTCKQTNKQKSSSSSSSSTTTIFINNNDDTTKLCAPPSSPEQRGHKSLQLRIYPTPMASRGEGMGTLGIWWKDHLQTWYISSGQIIIFHQPRFPWNKWISRTKPPFGVRSCEVAIIWPDILESSLQNRGVCFCVSVFLGWMIWWWSDPQHIFNRKHFSIQRF